MKLIINAALLIFFSATVLVAIASAERCGRNFNNSTCSDYTCCSKYGYCGLTVGHCSDEQGCQSMCWSQERVDFKCGPEVGNPPCGRNHCCVLLSFFSFGPRCLSQHCDNPKYCKYRCNLANSTVNSIADIVSKSLFNEMFKHRNECPSTHFYSYRAFLAAAEAFPAFGTVGDVATRKREIAAFLGQISQATTGEGEGEGKGSGLVDRDYTWGLCHITTIKKELTRNHNYGLTDKTLGLDLINHPELVATATDAIVSFKTAIWFWMTRHDNKPSCHDIVIKANSDPATLPTGYLIGKMIKDTFRHQSVVTTSVSYYKRYCDLLGVSYGVDTKYWYEEAPETSNFAGIRMVA